MAKPTFFDRLDQEALDRIVTALGLPIAVAAADAIRPMRDDDTISPELLIAAMVKVHALGLASALMGAPAISDGSPSKATLLQEQLLWAAIAIVRAELTPVRPTRETVQ